MILKLYLSTSILALAFARSWFVFSSTSCCFVSSWFVSWSCNFRLVTSCFVCSSFNFAVIIFFSYDCLTTKSATFLASPSTSSRSWGSWRGAAVWLAIFQTNKQTKSLWSRQQILTLVCQSHNPRVVDWQTMQFKSIKIRLFTPWTSQQSKAMLYVRFHQTKILLYHFRRLFMVHFFPVC